MMPSTSGSLDPSGIDVEAVDSIDGPRLRPTASADDRSNDEGRAAADRRVRDDALAADRDLREERVRRLADEVAALEAEVAALEAEVESKERQRQQVIDTYESIVAAQRTPDRSSESTPDASTEADRWRPLAAFASRVGRVAAWLRRRK
jgi:hypothetical protein